MNGSSSAAVTVAAGGAENWRLAMGVTEVKRHSSSFEVGNPTSANRPNARFLTGASQSGLAPPLADSEWVLGSDQRLTQIVLLGVRGPITVKGRTYSLEMPGLRASFDDEQIASVLTYIRREWDHTANAVAPATVKKLRAKVTKRNEAWSEGELLKMP